MNQCVSLCIPRISKEINKSIIAKKFTELNIGNVNKIDIITKTSENGTRFYSAFVHIQWNNSELSKYIIDRVTSGKDVKIIYEGFLFWKVLLNKSVAKAIRPGYYGYKVDNELPLSRSESCDTWERNSKTL